MRHTDASPDTELPVLSPDLRAKRDDIYAPHEGMINIMLRTIRLFNSSPSHGDSTGSLLQGEKNEPTARKQSKDHD